MINFMLSGYAYSLVVLFILSCAILIESDENGVDPGDAVKVIMLVVFHPTVIIYLICYYLYHGAKEVCLIVYQRIQDKRFMKRMYRDNGK